MDAGWQVGERWVSRWVDGKMHEWKDGWVQPWNVRLLECYHETLGADSER